ncbi:hypothetical protein Tco_0638511 [Tanacetum coccineum]
MIKVSSREIKHSLDLCFRDLVLLLEFRYYMKKKHRGSYAYFVESGNCLFSSSTKWVIDSGASDHMTEVLKSLVGLSSSSPFEAHCHLGHPSLQSLKKLCLEYSHLSSLNCDSCESAKHRRAHLSPRANKRTASPFELVHSDVWIHVLLHLNLVSSILSPLLMTTPVLLGFI